VGGEETAGRERSAIAVLHKQRWCGCGCECECECGCECGCGCEGELSADEGGRFREVDNWVK
jgi:hypothetical protein